MSGPALHGRGLVEGKALDGADESFRACDPSTGAELEPPFHEASGAQVAAAMAAAAGAHPSFEMAGREQRAKLLEAIASEIEALGDELFTRANLETGLPLGRLRGECGRTTGQLRRFAGTVREGSYLGLRIDRAQPDRAPAPRADLRRMQRAMGPVVVFGASNFPLAFSVAGGDTAAALAAGCPVVVKAHPAHPGTSELVGRAIARAVAGCELPAGVFGMVHGRDPRVGMALVNDPRASAVAFTGSLAAGRAIFDAASRRPTPIPVFAEMGSVNPVLLLPSGLQDPAATGAALAASVQQGVGQFCTNPGLVLGLASAQLDSTIDALARHAKGDVGTMLHAGIANAYGAGVGARQHHPALTRHDAAGDPPQGRVGAAVFSVSGADFLADPNLSEELFGPSTLVVRCVDAGELERVAASLPGQLTATIHGSDPGELAEHAGTVTALEQRVGRLLFGGVPTGVEVCDAMHHGGPYPATTAPSTTSVGTAAIERFVRPLCYQDAPQGMLPAELRDQNPQGLLRLVDGQWSTDSL